jgi:hypothetical protein
LRRLRRLIGEVMVQSGVGGSSRWPWFIGGAGDHAT